MAVDPQFLSISRWQSGERVFEVASRRRLDTRQIVPYFIRDGVVFAGVLERARASRLLRHESPLGLEPIGVDFAAVDETADILHHGDAIFTAHAGVAIDPALRQIAIPSVARSIGYLTELALPVALGIRDPGARELAVTWDGAEHAIRFAPVETWLDALDAPDAPRHTEDLRLVLRALKGPASPPALAPSGFDASAWIARNATRIWSGPQLANAVESPHGIAAAKRIGDARVDALRFLRFDAVSQGAGVIEAVTPSTGISLAVIPIVRAGRDAFALLWREPRVSVLERHRRQPLFDLPVQPHHVNATGVYVTPEVRDRLALSPSHETLATEAARVLSQAFGGAVRVLACRRLGPALEACPSTSTELRHRIVCEIDPGALVIPDDAFLVNVRDLSRAIAWGRVRDPVIVAALAEAGGAFGVDPFADARVGDRARRLAFVAKMTEGSTVQRRLQRYSSIESEQLEAPTYARLMTLLQHDFGVRVAYPERETDRSFFKAAFRVFMAADREEKRALQGLHWSHDAFHFALGNYTAPPDVDLAQWYASADPMPPERAPEGAAWNDYARALKAAEDEATFFSFYTLYAEKPSLARHVGKLTFHAALQSLGIVETERARAVFDAVTNRAELPREVSEHVAYRERVEVRELFAYMLGFRDYHLKDIRTAWKYAARDPYRALFVRFGLYETDADRYVASVRSFRARLLARSPGLDPLLAASGDARVGISLRVWDVVKGLRLVRAASESSSVRAAMWACATRACDRVEWLSRDWSRVRAEITNAEITPWNERVFGELEALALRVESARHAFWDDVASLGVLDDAVIAAERTRELPR